jgi:hypothetical protein
VELCKKWIAKDLAGKLAGGGFWTDYRFGGELVSIPLNYPIVCRHPSFQVRQLAGMILLPAGHPGVNFRVFHGFMCQLSLKRRLDNDQKKGHPSLDDPFVFRGGCYALCLRRQS